MDNDCHYLQRPPRECRDARCNTPSFIRNNDTQTHAVYLNRVISDEADSATAFDVGQFTILVSMRANQGVKLVVYISYVGKRVPDLYVNGMLPIPAPLLRQISPNVRTSVF